MSRNYDASRTFYADVFGYRLQEIGEGDCVFVHTGHGDLWGTAEWPTLSAEEKAQRREEFGKGEPGFGITCG